jgi:hypothetical protein
MAAHPHHVLFKAALATCLLLTQAQAYAAEEAIATDRPDVVESSAVVGKGRFQIETSFASERNEADGLKTTTRSTPTLLRYGLSDTTELRLETDGFIREQGGEHGFADIALGLKWHTHDGDEATGKPGIAWLLHTDLNTGASAFRGHGFRPSLRMVAEWELPHEFSLGVMPGVLVDTNEDNHRYTAAILAVTVGKSWTDNFRTFVEVAGHQLTSARNGGSVITYDAGIAYLISPTMQVDTAVYVGANQYTPDFQWTVGFSIKF